MPDDDDRGRLPELLGNTLRGADGDLGAGRALYVDHTDGDPTFAVVDTEPARFVPLVGAQVEEDGTVTVPYDQERVRTAPEVDPELDLTPGDEDRLYVPYGIRTELQEEDEEPEPEAPPMPVGPADAAAQAQEPEPAAGPAPEGLPDELALSAERLRVDTTRSEVGRARVHKRVVTQTQSVVVPLRSEEVVVERMAVDGEATGAELGEEVYDVPLTSEAPVVSKETVVVERVRLGTRTVTDEVTVTEEVGREELEVDVEGDAEVRP